jgi:hypothetical protein
MDASLEIPPVRPRQARSGYERGRVCCSVRADTAAWPLLVEIPNVHTGKGTVHLTYQPPVLYSQIKPATNNQSAVLFS